MTTLPLGETPLSLESLRALRDGLAPALALAPEAERRVRAARRAVDAAISGGQTVYGINTGFGKLSRVQIPQRDLRALQVNLVRSHAAGVGDLLPAPIARLAFALRIANLSRGYSGVRLSLIDHAMAAFNAGIVPHVPSQGSVGASGDLAPLAHMALVLIGEGHAWKGRRAMSGAEALAAAGLRPFKLGPKEGLSLLNGTQISTSLLLDGLLRARDLAKVADIACALSLEAFGGTAIAFDPRIHRLRPHRGSQLVASNVLRIVEGSENVFGPPSGGRVQDPYSFRCAPQVHGASHDALAHVEHIASHEANAVTDNPIVTEEGDILSGGNFHAQPVALAADHLKIAVAELASISERRLENLVNPDLSGLPAFLAPDSGLQSGMMIGQVTAAALVSENKVLAHPASVDSIPTSAGKEDHVSMATHAARHAGWIVTHATFVLAIELIAGVHALALAERGAAGRGVRAAVKAVRRVVKPLRKDRVQAPDFEAVRQLIEDQTLVAAVEDVVGELD